MPRIALDAMGGDHAPQALIEGALRVHGVDGVEVVLVGEPDPIFAFLKAGQVPKPWPDVLPAEPISDPSLSPINILRLHPNCAIGVMMKALSEGVVDGVVTAGHSGVALVSSVVTLGKLMGALRPGLAVRLPTERGEVILLDVGASVEATREHLVNLAQMGSLYAEVALGIESPQVGVLSNGEEAHKGTPLLREVMASLKASPLRYVGPVEANALFTSTADVLLCDGFVGNCILKGAEGAMEFALALVRGELGAAGVEAGVVNRVLGAVSRKVDYAEHGGALLLGVRGVVVVAHGRSGPEAVARAITLANEAAGGDGRRLVTTLEEALSLL